MATPDKFLTGAAGILFDERRIFNLDETMCKELWPSVTPFTTLASNRAMRTGLRDPIFKQFEHRSAFVNQRFTVTTALTIDKNGDESNALTIGTVTNLPTPAANGAWEGLTCEVWDSTLTTLRGQVLITDAVDGTTFKCKNLDADTSITTVSGDVFIVIGNAHGEGSESPQPWSDELRITWGSTQQFRTPVQVTGTLLQAALRGYSNELARLRMEKNKEHKMHIEKTLLYGKSPLGMNLDPDNNGNWPASETYRTGYDGNNVRTTMGIISAIEKYGYSSPTSDKQNIFTIPEATYSYKNFVDNMEKVFQYLPNGGQKTAFCGPKMLSYWAKLDQSSGFFSKTGFKINMSPTQGGSYGFNFRTLTTPHGNLNLVYTPALSGPRAGWMVCTTDENLSVVQYRPSQYKTNIKTDNAPDLVKDEWHDDLGLGMQLIETHNLFKLV